MKSLFSGRGRIALVAVALAVVALVLLAFTSDTLQEQYAALTDPDYAVVNAETYSLAPGVVNRRAKAEAFEENKTGQAAQTDPDAVRVDPDQNNPAAANDPQNRATENHGGEGPRTGIGPAQEQYDNRAFPNGYIDIKQVQAAKQAFDRVASRAASPDVSGAWKLLGGNNVVPGPVTYTGRAATNSGRVTALAISNTCTKAECDLWMGAAGGGVWLAKNALVNIPTWKYVGEGIPSNAIGSITIDPTDASGNTVYVGTGEPNGSSDSEAGVGLYKTTNKGLSWTLVAGSDGIAEGRSIAAIAIDPVNAAHIIVGTAVARHGSSSVNGGRFTPPDAPEIGLYETTGSVWTKVFTLPSDVVNPGSPNGSDFFRGGVSKVVFDRTGLTTNDESRVFASFFDYGVYRRSAKEDGDTLFHEIFHATGNGDVGQSSFARTEFALAPMTNGNLRIYVGDAWASTAAFYRIDNANQAAATVLAGWTTLSNSAKATPGFASYKFCVGQCSYDMPVASPVGHPDLVWIGGAMQYGEIFTAHQPSNGRAIQRSEDAGVSFTDMTNDMEKGAPLGMHPDQHAIVFNPANPDIAFIGSDGGVVRTNGAFGDASKQCDTRGLGVDDLADCKAWLKKIPVHIDGLNKGLPTLQFQSVSVSPKNPKSSFMGGTQDNGTWVYNVKPGAHWFESVGGDGGQSGFNAGNPSIIMHTYYDAQVDVNFKGSNPLGWDWIADRLWNSVEARSFYMPLIADPNQKDTWFVGMEHVWRTQDNGGAKAFLDTTCNEYFGTFAATCGDWVTLGGPDGHDTAGNLVSATNGYGADKSGSYVAAVTRAPSDANTLWVGTRIGRLFVSTNANATDASTVTFDRIDTANTPTRFISGIAVDPTNPNHAYVSFSGYDAYAALAGTKPGHVFEVTYNPGTHSATWTDISNDLGDQPITGIAWDSTKSALYVSTDWGVLVLASGSTHYAPAGTGLPPVAVYGLTISDKGRVLYAATHGRSIWQMSLK